MFGSIGKVLSGAVKTVGDFIPGVGDARAQEKANKQNLQLDKQNRDWMERMSNTAYQRAMDDMKSSGLNPMLSYMQGGASVPTTQAATVGAASKTGLADAAMQAYTGISAARTAQQQANTAQASAESGINLQATQAANTAQDTLNKQVTAAHETEKIKNTKVARELQRQQHDVKKIEQKASNLVHSGIERIEQNVMKNSAKWKSAIDLESKKAQYRKQKGVKPDSSFSGIINNFKSNFMKGN